MAYLECFAPCPYFHEQVTDKVRAAQCYTISFDECIYGIFPKEQMELIVNFWDQDPGQLSVRYMESKFLGHASKKVLLSWIQGSCYKSPWTGLMSIGNSTVILRIQTKASKPMKMWITHCSWCFRKGCRSHRLETPEISPRFTS